MKFLVFCLSFISTLAFAQTIGVKDIPADGDTTIRVEKGVKNQNAWEITSGTDEIEGEAAPLLKEARANWKKACTEWKQETKEMNKEKSRFDSELRNHEVFNFCNGDNVCV
jgi:hypothetical protein